MFVLGVCVLKLVYTNISLLSLLSIARYSLTKLIKCESVCIHSTYIDILPMISPGLAERNMVFNLFYLSDIGEIVVSLTICRGTS